MTVPSVDASNLASRPRVLGPPRLAFLDMSKGFLVVLMVVYHSLNYTSQYHLSFRYLSFLPPSFILITGFLISIVYFPRYLSGDRRVWSRLLSRGAKLLLLFIGLNVVAQYVRSPAYGHSIGVATFFREWHEIFVIGGARAAAFEVLLPIAYLLLLSPALIWLAHRHALWLPGITTVLVATCAWLDWRGGSYANLHFLSAGVIGMLAGRLIRTPESLGRPLLAAIAGYAVYFPISIAKGYVYLVQLFGAAVVLILLCGVSLRWGEAGRLQQIITTIGQYSLFSYIAQIGLLQTFSRFVGRPDPVSFESAAIFFGTLILMVAAVEFAAWARQRSAITNRLYTWVFA